ncbi:MAG: M20 family metallopeptidase [Chloroflexi bacterium]|nr:M20 family metallopeptidase [Chloroflexota bacterium]MDA1146492.1 M20 family metallopeptidase [Chloroflexota bacterium]
MPFTSAEQAALDAIRAASGELRALSLDIHAHPELGYEETHAHDALADYLAGAGFAVERSAHGMETSFRASAGSGGPVVAALCEYDALPEIGHACGHNLIAIAGVAVGLGLRAALRDSEVRGTVLVLGAPAEERGGGGKLRLIEAGAFEGVDAAVMLHPGMGDEVRPSSLAHHGLTIEFHGQASHAAGAPWRGVNALDAMLLGFAALGLLRQQIEPTHRVHGVITHGGDSPNIIPERTEARLLVRAPTREQVDALRERVLACFSGAAQQTGCTLDATWSDSPYENLRQNPKLADAYLESFEALGGTIRPGLGGGSTDMGNVSQVLPGLHPHYRIPSEGGNHTRAFTGAAATEESHEATIRAAQALALASLRAFEDAEFLRSMGESFEAGARGGR